LSYLFFYPIKGDTLNNIKIIVDNKIIEKYNQYYFSKYPKRRKVPIDNPIPPSLNKFTSWKRIQQNSVKQIYKEFVIWLASFYHIDNLMLDKVFITYIYYFKDHRRRDMDNMMLSPKFYNDGLVISRTLADDNANMLEIKFESFKYDKENPRMELLIEWE
jgi:hypothetical protein